jgi:arylsulfatase
MASTKNDRLHSTDNGPEYRPHGGTTPFRGEKMTTCQGGVRVI